MNAKYISSSKHSQKSKTNWRKVKNLTEKQLDKAAKSDPDALPLTQADLGQFKRVHPPKSIDVRLIRLKLNMTQAEFAKYFGVSVRTIQEWEQKRRLPSVPARNFLRVIEKEPKAVQRALGKKAA